MSNYRAAFLVVLVINLFLVVIAGGLWWHTRASASVAPARVGAAQAAVPASTGVTAPEPALPTEVPLTPVTLSPQRLQSIGVRLGEVQRKIVDDRILTTGNVAIDETRLAYVQLRFSGYIQQVFVDATYEHVHKGEPLFTIYSPELVSTEREYLIARQSQRALAKVSDPEVALDTRSIVQAAAQRLNQWGISPREIQRLNASGQIQPNLEIDSPVSGYVTEREALPNKYAQPDTQLYTVADLSTIWVFAQVFQNDLGRLKVGDRATLTVDTYPGRSFTGRVDFIYPDVDTVTRTARVRLTFQNSTLALKPGMFVSVAIEVPMGEHTVVPATAVLQTGTRAIVFVDRGQGNLQPRDVELGAQVGDDFIVLKGLDPGEKVVTSANFLIDSESQLQAALAAFTPAPSSTGAAAEPTTVAPATVELTTEPNPARRGRNVLRVKLTGGNGSALVGAQVTATFLMAAMPTMGMAAMRVTVALRDQGGGQYLGSIQLPSGGTWEVTVLASKDGRTVATRQLSVSATGGM